MRLFCGLSANNNDSKCRMQRKTERWIEKTSIMCKFFEFVEENSATKLYALHNFACFLMGETEILYILIRSNKMQQYAGMYPL